MTRTPLEQSRRSVVELLAQDVFVALGEVAPA
jgi:hypothetical protein